MQDTRQPVRAQPGTVYLVGAGPGDPDLLTLRARELLRAADLILFDNLTSAEVLSFGRPDADRRYVGKKRAEQACTQDEINGVMVAAALDGKAVVRLKGGDPYVFGRGGEEAQALARAGVQFEVVPGVTSALGAAAYAGMPLTHRDFTQAVTFVTGHDVDCIDWRLLAAGHTLVVFMGLVSIAEIARRLTGAGLAPSTPAAALRWVTRGDQRVVSGTLEALPDAVRREGLKPPALVVIGEIVMLREEIDWFDRLPLRGQSVAVTRASAQSAEFCGELRRLGAHVISVPTIEFEPPSDWGPADRALRDLPGYDWLVFTSVNGVDRFLARLDAASRDLRDLPRGICAIGPATAQRLRSLRLRANVVPEEFVAESLVAEFESRGVRGSRVLIPRAEEARDVLPVRLAGMGARVDVVPVYRTVLPRDSMGAAAAAWGAPRPPDWVTATSSSTLRNLAKLVPVERLRKSKLASIGPVTSATARDLGLSVAAEASFYTTDGLIQALVLASSAGAVPP